MENDMTRKYLRGLKKKKKKIHTYFFFLIFSRKDKEFYYAFLKSMMLQANFIRGENKRKCHEINISLGDKYSV